MKQSIGLFVVGSMLIIVMACSGPRSLTQSAQPTSEEDKSIGIVNEFFDPLILDDEDLQTTKTISIESKSDKIQEELLKSDAEPLRGESVTGYRVQICALSDEERAKEIYRSALLKFPNEEVYLIYDSPYYKVRVGNCPTRQEADRLQQLAVEKGFDDAWVVRTKIKPKSTE
ncbi:MAG: SPOR domain-containing protein [candidate division KSB1 bacterium]|nr:SPOR domain-containing protein [candidate division KSB1 bacterium]MDZ7336285.1 SPOR domain-containing protein [candidate division KSB1 bacterium]MDZ7358098.1 SPOR domain-containing protein [candidate division KSB1 bacterium]MDZ7375084.1 SPOR domain-containing protein [candidate division KSB1 bacterium]MDZ7399497.1 SPOR domain-containing protein [candidate division KSB1 bacterium]